MVEKPEIPHFKIPFVIGAGSGGGKVVSEISVPRITKVAINSSWKDLDFLKEDVRKVEMGDIGKGSGMDPRMGEKHYKMSRKKLKEELLSIVRKCKYEPEDVSMIPVIVSTGFGFGSGSGPELVKDLKKWFPRAVILAFAITPFDFEGVGAQENSYYSCRKMAEEVGLILVSNAYVAELVGAEKTLDRMLEKVNKYIASIINTFLEITSTSSVLAGIDETDLRRVVDRGLIYMLTRTFMSEEEGLDRLYDSDSMLAKYSFKRPKLPVDMLAFIQSSRLPSKMLIDQIMKKTEEKLTLYPRTLKVGIFSGDQFRISLLIGGLRWWQDQW
jgi:cell division GTPase FtsZ